MDAVEAAFLAQPRAHFLPSRHRGRETYDGPLEIGHGQTNSQPRTVADMLRLLDVHPGQSILDVGSGSGWTTALLAELTGPTGKVLGLELEPELTAFGAANLSRADRPWARIEQADPETLGRPDEAPYDRILVSAEPDALPLDLVDQLAPDGRMVIPVRGTLLLISRDPTGELAVTEHGSYRFVPLHVRES